MGKPVRKIDNDLEMSSLVTTIAGIQNPVATALHALMNRNSGESDLGIIKFLGYLGLGFQARSNLLFFRTFLVMHILHDKISEESWWNAPL